jgi:hypothetical protein
MAICMGAAGTLARRKTPGGVAKRQPRASGASERQCTSVQIPGSRCRLAATSSMKIDGMISDGGKTSDRAVIASNEKPKPE